MKSLIVRVMEGFGALRTGCLQTRNAWVLFSFTVSYLIAALYCSHAYARDPTSVFFKQAKGYQRHYSQQREQEARAFISALNASSTVSAFNTTQELLPDALLCIAVSTTARAHHQYVQYTIGSLLEGLSDNQRRSIDLRVLIAHTEPDLHPILREPWLSATVNRIVQYNVPELDMERLRSLEINRKVWEKSTYDYEYILNDCLASGASWIMTVEDDVLAASGWFERAISAVNAIDKHTSNDRDWLYLRMFYTEKFLGWNREDWISYLGWSVLCFVSLFIVLIAGRVCSRRLRQFLMVSTILIICGICLPLTILLYFAAGKISMQPLPPGLQRMERSACCGQGFIYPRKIIPRVMQRIRSARNVGGTLDGTLERWADKEHLARYVLVPSLLQDNGYEPGKNLPDVYNFEWEDHV